MRKPYQNQTLRRDNNELRERSMETETPREPGQYCFSEILYGLLERAQADDAAATAELKAAEEALTVARKKRDIARKQLSSANLASGLNSDGTPRKVRGSNDAA